MHWLFPLGTDDGEQAPSLWIYWPLLIWWLNRERQVRGAVPVGLEICYEFHIVGDGGFCVQTEQDIVPRDTFSHALLHNAAKCQSYSLERRRPCVWTNFQRLAADTSIRKRQIQSDSEWSSNTFPAVCLLTSLLIIRDAEQKTDNAWIAFTVAASVIH